MKIPNTDFTLEELLDQLPIGLHYVDKEGFLRYQSKVAAAPKAKVKREVGANIEDCHFQVESLAAISRIMKDFNEGHKEPHYYLTPTGEKAEKVPLFDEEGKFCGILSYSYPVGVPMVKRSF